MTAVRAEPGAHDSRLRIADYAQRLRSMHPRRHPLPRADQAADAPDGRAALRALDVWGWRLVPLRTVADDGTVVAAVGPGGVLVADVREWSDPDVVDGHLFRGPVRADDVIDGLCAAADAVADAVSSIGVPPLEIVPVLVLAGQHDTELVLGRVRVFDDRTVAPWAVGRGPRLDPERVDAIATVLAQAFPAPADDTPPTPDTGTAGVPRGRHAIPVDDSGLDPDRMSAAVVAHAVATLPTNAGATPDWVTSLDPEQLAVVRAPFGGVVTVSGAAGTGKTVLGLHRAAQLAAQGDEPVLVTAMDPTLPPVLRTLYRRLTAGSAAHGRQVEFVPVHKWASRLLRARGRRVLVDARRTDAAFESAWRGEAGTALDDIGVTDRYCREEIDHVLKGRGIGEFAEYATLARVGRQLPLGLEHRRLVWRVYEAYEAALHAEGLTDLNDLVALARTEVATHPLDTPHAAVIVDESQDLTCAAVRLLAELARPDGADGRRGELLLLGDGRQQIYPGGYVLAEAGLTVDRSAVLTVNHRNAGEIARAADIAATGGTVEMARFRDRAALRAAVVDRVFALLGCGRPATGIAVLCDTEDDATTYAQALRRAGLPVLTLDHYVGAAAHAIKVGTVARAKGLEFGDVVHPLPTVPGARHAAPTAVAGEATGVSRRVRYVAMTRARDSVWIGATERDAG